MNNYQEQLNEIRSKYGHSGGGGAGRYQQQLEEVWSKYGRGGGKKSESDDTTDTNGTSGQDNSSSSTENSSGNGTRPSGGGSASRYQEELDEIRSKYGHSGGGGGAGRYQQQLEEVWAKYGRGGGKKATGDSDSNGSNTNGSSASTNNSSQNDIDISYAEMENNIAVLKESINTLSSNWNQLINTNVSTIKNSWAGKDCEVYIDKVLKLDSKVKNAISALELLANTYEQAKNQMQEQQAKVAGTLNNL